jgi:hypothetical protein
MVGLCRIMIPAARILEGPLGVQGGGYLSLTTCAAIATT